MLVTLKKSTKLKPTLISSIFPDPMILKSIWVSFYCIFKFIYVFISFKPVKYYRPVIPSRDRKHHSIHI